MKKVNTLHHDNRHNFLSKCLGSSKGAYIAIIIGIIVLVILAMIGFNSLVNVKEQLNSCRSSMRSM